MLVLRGKAAAAAAEGVHSGRPLQSSMGLATVFIIALMTATVGAGGPVQGLPVQYKVRNTQRIVSLSFGSRRRAWDAGDC